MRSGMEERELLHTDGLSVGYHGRELIKEIGISLKMGEIVTLIGPNGAGKSTILKTIAKQLQEICGSVYVENINLSELPEKELAKKMSIVFTERITPELMTVADVVAMGRYPYTGGLGILIKVFPDTPYVSVFDCLKICKKTVFCQ
jgi:iron complex transport system ATP-binding protein